MNRGFVCAMLFVAFLLPGLCSGEVLVDISITAGQRGYTEKNPVGPIKSAKFTVPGPGTLQVTYEVDPYRGPDSAPGRAGGWELFDFPGCENRRCIPGHAIPMKEPTPVVGKKYVRVYRSGVTEGYANRTARLVPTFEWAGFDSREGNQWGATKRLKVEFFPRGSEVPTPTDTTGGSSGTTESTSSMGDIQGAWSWSCCGGRHSGTFQIDRVSADGTFTGRFGTGKDDGESPISGRLSGDRMQFTRTLLSNGAQAGEQTWKARLVKAGGRWTMAEGDWQGSWRTQGNGGFSATQR